ncbi:MAG TPA: hypothetical protein VLV87_07795 [Gammaproteobacteria bacterium]|nr:hypothetical protein [Gammaproteobacteria bacterium]
MNTAVMKLHWFAAVSTWLRGAAQPKARDAKPATEEKPRVRIAGLR